MRRACCAISAFFLIIFFCAFPLSAAEYDFYGGEQTREAEDYDLGALIDELPDEEKTNAVEIAEARKRG